MAVAAAKLTSGVLSVPSPPRHLKPPPPPSLLQMSRISSASGKPLRIISVRKMVCNAAEVSSLTEASDKNWVPVVPMAALPRGERRVIIQDGETILLLWYKDEVFAIENRSPAEGAYTEGLLNAKLTQGSEIALLVYGFHHFDGAKSA
ncbi:rieske (2Fe-2S) domain-containing protein [Actinidia rufa]|uniref:Rieske (2Fe-2S) domain-containing protein n=1 Tax=Actinidia rufa TaxID=165716 RepID=A0A7J0GG76_9ERIC|nr:rieske (2Fe-2S) domain-containing protein [Actinidia rufa]